MSIESDWVVYDYEVDMLRSTSAPGPNVLPHYVRNAIVESRLLHTRILVEILLSRHSKPDDITLEDFDKTKGLLPGFKSPMIAELRAAYGDNETEGSPCWTLNKRLAHATSVRGSNYDYTSLVQKLEPLISALIEEVARERQKRAS